MRVDAGIGRLIGRLGHMNHVLLLASPKGLELASLQSPGLELRVLPDFSCSRILARARLSLLVSPGMLQAPKCNTNNRKGE